MLFFVPDIGRKRGKCWHRQWPVAELEDHWLLKSGLHKSLSKDNSTEFSVCVQAQEGGEATEAWDLLWAVTWNNCGQVECLCPCPASESNPSIQCGLWVWCILQVCLPNRLNSSGHRQQLFCIEWSHLLEHEPTHGDEMCSSQPGLPPHPVMEVCSLPNSSHVAQSL